MNHLKQELRESEQESRTGLTEVFIMSVDIYNTKP